MKKNRILLIGNSGSNSSGADGQTAKVRLYCKKIIDEGFDLLFVDLYKFKRHPIQTLFLIRKYLKLCDRIVLLTAERGAKLLIPFINYINKKNKKPFIFPLIGISILHYSIDQLSNADKISFFEKENYSIASKSKRLCRSLLKIDYILPETALLTKIFANFYGLTNVQTLNNFRDEELITIKKENKDELLHLVFLSRVTKVKGIFDLLEVVSDINTKEKVLSLDIYGDMNLSANEEPTFYSLIKNDCVRYHGSISNSEVVNTIGAYDLFVFPTLYYGEGTPGVVAESLIAGTPILTSNFIQASLLLKDNFDSLFFKLGDKNDLKQKLLYIINNRAVLKTMTNNCRLSGQKFTYLNERDKFLKYICGVEEK